MNLLCSVHFVNSQLGTRYVLACWIVVWAPLEVGTSKFIDTLQTFVAAILLHEYSTKMLTFHFECWLTFDSWTCYIASWTFNKDVDPPLQTLINVRFLNLSYCFMNIQQRCLASTLNVDQCLIFEPTLLLYEYLTKMLNLHFEYWLTFDFWTFCSNLKNWSSPFKTLCKSHKVVLRFEVLNMDIEKVKSSQVTTSKY